jgi:PAS domain S-box-containing protein
MYMTDEVGGTVWLNQRWLEFRARTLAEELGEGWTEGIHPDDLPALMDAFQDQVRRHVPLQLEYRIRRHDGRYRWMLDQAVPCFGADDRFIGYIGTVVDISERREAEQRLRETLERHRELLDREAAMHRELNHRVRNNLAGLLGMLEVYRRRYSDPDEMCRAFQGKIRAMCDVHDLAAAGGGTDLRVRDLVERVAAASLEGGGTVQIDGPATRLTSRRAQALAMILQELFTNSRKHGALRLGGCVRVHWTMRDHGDVGSSIDALETGPCLELIWHESADGPPATLARTGTGVALIEGLAKSELRGEATFAPLENGLLCVIRTG